jgi:hypothetical protein
MATPCGRRQRQPRFVVDRVPEGKLFRPSCTGWNLGDGLCSPSQDVEHDFPTGHPIGPASRETAASQGATWPS